MHRTVYKELLAWKNEQEPLPLLVRGARQVGKSYLIEKFAEQEFKNYIVLNFELHPEYAQFFTTLVPEEIIQKIKLFLGKPLIPGETLLFLDEIQECPSAIQALRYFKELLPGLHVIGAGSLLEFSINDHHLRMPVGRVAFLYVRPLSFQEFLLAIGRQDLVDYLAEVTLATEIPTLIHEQLLQRVREYMILGGMPAVIQKYLTEQDYSTCQRVQTILLNTYRADFGKYAKLTDHKYLQSVFRMISGLIGQTVMYSRIDPHAKSRDIKRAIELLTQANILYPVYATSAAGLPLSALINEKKFKLVYLDVGLVNNMSSLNAEVLLQEDVLLVNRGAMAEQFVGQELLAYMDPYNAGELFFWIREGKNNAEVDYLMTVGSCIIPIEVKAGKTGNLKSLHILLEQRKLPFGVRVSQLPLNLEKNILSVPLYMISELPRLVKSLMH